jgi:hypothetical protein
MPSTPITAKTGWSAECLLAGLMDIVPELTKPGETQGLIGDPPRSVIDHEDKSARQQQ